MIGPLFFLLALLGSPFLNLLVGAPMAHAQTLSPGVDPNAPKQGTREPPPSFLTPGVSDRTLLPPPPVPPESDQKKFPVLRMFIREIRVDGSTVFTPAELARVVEPYVNRDMTTEDVEELRTDLTALYTDHGFVNSGAFVPDQEIQDGVLTMSIVEGRLSDIHMTGLDWFNPIYFEQRIRLSAGSPLNIRAVRRRLQWLLQDSRVVRLTSELKPGLKPGDAELHVRVEEAVPYTLSASFNNFQNPTVGEARVVGTLLHRNLFGFGDTFRFEYGESEGVDPIIDTSYTLPITPWDTRLSLGFRNNDFVVVEEPFASLQVASSSRSYSGTVRHPLFRTVNREFAIFLTAEYLENTFSLFGRPTPLILGSQDGVTNVFAWRFGQEWLQRDRQQVVSLRSRLSIGMDVFDATINHTDQIPSGQFVSWLGQAQWVRRFDPWGIQLLGHVDLQVAKDRLFPQEQFPIGGRYSVRGYRENTVVRDNALLVSLEARLPLWRAGYGVDSIDLAPFGDFGKGWETEISTSSPKQLASIGVGLRVSVLQHATFHIYWGHQLIDVPTFGNTLQDQGVHVQFSLQLP